jgi:hypothetical protein
MDQDQVDQEIWEQAVEARREECAALETSVVTELLKSLALEDAGIDIAHTESLSPVDQVEKLLIDLFAVASNNALDPEERRKHFDTLEQLRIKLDEAVAAQKAAATNETTTATTPPSASETGSSKPPHRSVDTDDQTPEKAAARTSPESLESSKSGKLAIEQLDLRTGEVLATFPSISDATAKYGLSRAAISQQLHGRAKSCKGFFWRTVGSTDLPHGLNPHTVEASAPKSNSSKDLATVPAASKRKSPVTVAPTASNSTQKSSSEQRPSSTANLAAKEAATAPAASKPKDPVTVAPTASNSTKNRSASITARLAAASASTTEEAASAVAAVFPGATSKAAAPATWGSSLPSKAAAPATRGSSLGGVAPPPYQRTSDTVSVEKAKKKAKSALSSASSSAPNVTRPQIAREVAPVVDTASTNVNTTALSTSTSTAQVNSSKSNKRLLADDSDMDISADDASTGPTNQSTGSRNGQEPPKKVPRTEKFSTKIAYTTVVMDTKTAVSGVHKSTYFPPDRIPNSKCYSFALKARNGVRAFYKSHWPSDEMSKSAGQLFEMWEPFWQVEQVVKSGVTSKIELLEWEDNKRSPVRPLTVGVLDFPSLSGDLASKIDWGTNKSETGRKPKDGDYALLLRMLPTQIDPKYKNKRSNCHLWPKGTFLTVNGEPVVLQQRIQANHDETKWEYQSHPLDLAQHIKSAPKGETTLTMCCYDRTPFLYMVAICCYKSPSTLTKGLLQPNNRFLQRLSWGESCEKAMGYIHQQSVSLDDDDRETNGQATKVDGGKLVFSLLDPVMKVPMTTPVRGIRCKHWQVRAC